MAEHFLRCDTGIAIYAFRYALGRRTYAVGQVSGWLIANVEHFDIAERKLIVKEIDEQARLAEGLGHACDASDWMKVRSVFDPEGRPNG